MPALPRGPSCGLKQVTPGAARPFPRPGEASSAQCQVLPLGASRPHRRERSSLAFARPGRPRPLRSLGTDQAGACLTRTGNYRQMCDSGGAEALMGSKSPPSSGMSHASAQPGGATVTVRTTPLDLTARAHSSLQPPGSELSSVVCSS